MWWDARGGGGGCPLPQLVFQTAVECTGHTRSRMSLGGDPLIAAAAAASVASPLPLPAGNAPAAVPRRQSEMPYSQQLCLSGAPLIMRMLHAVGACLSGRACTVAVLVKHRVSRVAV